MTWRSFLGAAVLTVAVVLLVAAGRMRHIHWSSLTPLHHLQVVAVAAMTILTNLAVFTAFEKTSIAVVLICFYTFPVMVAVAAVRVYGEPLSTTRVLALLLASAGMLLVVIAPALGQEGVAVEPIGILLGLVAAASQAVYALIAGRGFPSLTAGQAAMATSSAAALGFLALAVLGGSAAALREPFDGGGWIWLVLGGIVGLAVPTAAVLAGFRQLGPARASILMLAEPVVGVLLAALFVSERPSPLQLVGGLLVLAGGALAQVRWRSWRSRKVQQAEAELL